MVFAEPGTRLFYSLLSGESNEILCTLGMSSLQYSAFFCLDRVARGLDDVSNNRLKYVDVPGIRIPKIPSLFTPESTTSTYALPVVLCNFEFIHVDFVLISFWVDRE